MKPTIAWFVFALALASVPAARAAEVGSSWQLETRIPLGEVKGRIDHLAVDVEGRRVFVAELGNGSVAVVGIEQRALTQRIAGLRTPQGVAWSPDARTLYVASEGDGTVRAFSGMPLVERTREILGDDADNVRVDPDRRHVEVGFGSGAIAILDAASLRPRVDVPLAGHPESFQIERDGARVFVNVPDAGEIAVVDRAADKVIARWSTGALRQNFAMALDEAGSRLFAVFRQPAVIGAFSLRSGKLVTQVATCGDVDDVFVDARRARLYVVCGDGHVDTRDLRSSQLARVSLFETAPGARTGLFSPELDRLFVAVRTTERAPAAIWVLRPGGVSADPVPAAR